MPPLLSVIFCTGMTIGGTGLETHDAVLVERTVGFGLLVDGPAVTAAKFASRKTKAAFSERSFVGVVGK